MQYNTNIFLSDNSFGTDEANYGTSCMVTLKFDVFKEVPSNTCADLEAAKYMLRHMDELNNLFDEMFVCEDTVRVGDVRLGRCEISDNVVYLEFDFKEDFDDLNELPTFREVRVIAAQGVTYSM